MLRPSDRHWDDAPAYMALALTLPLFLPTASERLQEAGLGGCWATRWNWCQRGSTRRCAGPLSHELVEDAGDNSSTGLVLLLVLLLWRWRWPYDGDGLSMSMAREGACAGRSSSPLLKSEDWDSSGVSECPPPSPSRRGVTQDKGEVDDECS